MTRTEWLAEHDRLSDALELAAFRFYRLREHSRARDDLWAHARTLPEPERTHNAPSSDLADSIDFVVSQYCDPIPAFLRGAS